MVCIQALQHGDGYPLSRSLYHTRRIQWRIDCKRPNLGDSEWQHHNIGLAIYPHMADMRATCQCINPDLENL
jgi:hypothetical protein